MGSIYVREARCHIALGGGAAIGIVSSYLVTRPWRSTQKQKAILVSGFSETDRVKKAQNWMDAFNHHKGVEHALDHMCDSLNLWLLELLSGYKMGGVIHILLVISIIIVLVRVIQGRKIL